MKRPKPPAGIVLQKGQVSQLTSLLLVQIKELQRACKVYVDVIKNLHRGKKLDRLAIDNLKKEIAELRKTK